MFFAPRTVATIAAIIGASALLMAYAGASEGDREVPQAVVTSAPARPSPVPSGNDPCGGPTRLLASLNRPTVGFSTCVVPRGAVVLEEGYQITTIGGQSPSVLVQYPQGFERIGVTDRFEAVIVGPNFNRNRTTAGTSSGYSDYGVGIKYEFAPKTRFSYAFDALITSATGGAAYTSGSASEIFNVDLSYQVSQTIGVGTTLAGLATGGVTTIGSSSAPGYMRYGAFFPSLVVTTLVHGGTQFYAELVGQTRTSAAPGGRTLLDLGVQKLLGPSLELDAEYGAVLAPIDSRANYIGIGTGLRLR